MNPRVARVRTLDNMNAVLERRPWVRSAGGDDDTTTAATAGDNDGGNDDINRKAQTTIN